MCFCFCVQPENSSYRLRCAELFSLRLSSCSWMLLITSESLMGWKQWLGCTTRKSGTVEEFHLAEGFNQRIVTCWSRPYTLDSYPDCVESNANIKTGQNQHICTCIWTWKSAATHLFGEVSALGRYNNAQYKEEEEAEPEEEGEPQLVRLCQRCGQPRGHVVWGYPVRGILLGLRSGFTQLRGALQQWWTA